MLDDYHKKLVAMLTNAYSREDVRREKPTTVIGKVLYTIASSFAVAMNSLKTIKEWRNLDYAEGAFLDKYGANYGVKRQGSSDEFYRLMIKVKMLAQLSGGDTDTIINAVAILYNIDPTKVHYEDVYPAKIKLSMKREDLNEGYRDVQVLINQLVNRIIAAGVGYEIYHTIPVNLSNNIYAGAMLTTRYVNKEIKGYSIFEGGTVKHTIYTGLAITSRYKYKEIEGSEIE